MVKSRLELKGTRAKEAILNVCIYMQMYHNDFKDIKNENRNICDSDLVFCCYNFTFISTCMKGTFAKSPTRSSNDEINIVTVTQ